MLGVTWRKIMNSISEISASLKKVYAALQDEESQIIYMNMVNYFFSGDIRYILQRGHFNNHKKDLDSSAYSISDFILNHPHNKRDEIIVYGANDFNSAVVNSFRNIGIDVKYFCDFNQNKQNRMKDGLPVISPTDVVEHHKNSIVLFTNHNHDVSRIIKLGLTHGMNQNQFKIPHPFGKIYFGLREIVPYENEIFLDCGSYTGNTVMNFLSWNKGKYKKIYAIEPEHTSYTILQQNMLIKNVKHIRLLNEGVWSCSDTFPFYQDGEMSSFCKDAYFLSPSLTHARVNTIDNIVHTDLVTFIKMDIQGGELEALKGAADTIKRSKPRLAISVYHKTKDIIEIPLFIHNLVPEYRFFIRQHTFLTDDTVLYAI